MDLAVKPPPVVTEDATEKLAIILMGVTGSGKSTFISLLTDQNVEVGHGLESHTTEAASYAFKDNNREIILIDTPGFDDTTRSDSEILQEMAHFLVALFDSDVRLAGIVYLHRITDPRFSGTAVKNLEILQRLCGPSNFDSVVLVMNMWDRLDVKTATQRESELRQTFWANMLQGNSTMTPHTGTRESALQIVRALVDNAKPRLVLSIQHELAVEVKTLDATEAGQFVQKEMLEVKEKHQQDVAYLKSSMDDAIQERDANLLRTLREEREAADAKVRATVLETQRMNMTLDQLVSLDGYHKAQRLLPPSSKRQSTKFGAPSTNSNPLFPPPGPESYISIPQEHNFAPFSPSSVPDSTIPIYNRPRAEFKTSPPNADRYPSSEPTFSDPIAPLERAQHRCKPECEQRCEQEKLQLQLREAEEYGRSLKSMKSMLEQPPSRRDHETHSHGHKASHGGSKHQGGHGHGDHLGSAIKSVGKTIIPANWSFWKGGSGSRQQARSLQEDLAFGVSPF